MHEIDHERFWGRVAKSPDCWIWQAGRSRDGYGMFRPRGGMPVCAHKIAWEMAYGLPPPDSRFHQLCKNKTCVNPAHIITRPNNRTPKVRVTSEQRFWDKVNKDGECWEWIAFRDPQGYGRVTVHGRTTYAHRVSWEMATGQKIPEGLHIDHLCRNRACVNPSHLEPVTCRENVIRGYGMAGINYRKRTCGNGHELQEHPSGKRRWCPPCHRAKDRERQAKVRATRDSVELIRA